ncbi:MAG: YebC/PmpR family DNA-binding transcriptional regulator [Clostridiales bacterium]|jgi:YebC/PmpR family DNA-binding regulatory protein|nr:YebC/PmpR family DNA-binding transcriptional regulator [Clostridiales bacterium]
MSGHSKFANIKHKKAKNDAVKGKIYTKLGREIAVAVKSGGGDPNINGKLRDVIAKAKANNMPNDSIERSIKKAEGDPSGVNYENVTYEGYGPNGIAIIVEALTDNRNRAAANVRNAFSKGGGNMGTTGCVSFMFKELGQIMALKSSSINEDELMLLALENGAADFSVEDEGYIIQCEPEDFQSLKGALSGIEMESAEITKIPDTYVTLADPEDIKKMNKLLDLLDDEDDVQ